QDVVGEIGEVDRGIGVAATGVPDPMRTKTIDRHEADLGRLLGPRDVVDPDARRETALVLELVRRRAAEIRLLVLKLLHGPDARRVDRQQQIVVGLQMKSARAGRARDEIEHLWTRRVAYVHGGDAIAEAVADISVAA